MLRAIKTKQEKIKKLQREIDLLRNLRHLIP